MLFGFIRVNKPSPLMGAKHSHDHSPTTQYSSSSSSHHHHHHHHHHHPHHHSVRGSSSSSSSIHEPASRVSTGRVSSTYRPLSPKTHAEVLRRTGRRKLAHRGKSHSDPGFDKPSLTQIPGHDHRLQNSRVQVHDSFDASQSSHKMHEPCCHQCAKTGMEWEKYKPSAVVKDYAAVSTQNSKFRKHMEDECVVIPKFRAFHGDPAKSSFFAVYDGHGGSFCARYAARNFHSRLSASIAGRVGSKQRYSDAGSRRSALTASNSSGSTACSERDGDVLSVHDIERCFGEACATLDEELSTYDESAACGSTAVTCLVRKYNGRTSFHIANLGDSRAIMFANGVTSRLTVDHKATNEDEVKRIKAHNGIILNKRVGGVISVTRAFGQSDEKEFITANPHTQSGEIKSNDSFLVLASDGVTDVFSDEEVTEFVAERLHRGEKSITICKSLLDEAKMQGAMDNMTAVLICFSDME